MPPKLSQISNPETACFVAGYHGGMKNYIHSLFVMVAIAIYTPAATANNNLFLPGDAYFPTQLTAAEIDVLTQQAQGPYVFEYSSFDTYGLTFCGYAGYERVTFSAVDKAFIDNLAAAYRAIRQRQPRLLLEEKENGKTVLVEQNGIRVFFYRSDFDLDQNTIALRYNENWVEEAVKFGHRADHLRLCCMYPKAAAVERSWRDSKRVPGLDLIRPTDKNSGLKVDPFGDEKPAKPKPVVVQGQVKAIIVLRPSLSDYFNPGANKYLPLHVVDSDGHGKITRKNSKWVPIDAEADATIEDLFAPTENPF